jgi:mono/diheme cytochrome c family protein
MKQLILWAGVAILCGAAARAQSQPLSTEAANALLQQYCSGCHNDRLKTGGMTLTSLDRAHPDQTAELAEKIIRKLRAGMMPPAGMPRPDAATLKNLAASLEAQIDRAAAAHPNPGRPALHRLNRTEYANSVRDLLDMNVNVAALLPPDDMSHGFDNMTDALTVSPALMEGYLRASSKISRQAVGDPKAAATTMTFHIPRVISQTKHIDGTPFGTRGGLSVMFDFPADGEYVFKSAFYYSLDGPLFGRNQGKTTQLEVSIDGERVALLEIDPNIKLTDYPSTPPIKVQAGPHRVSAAFIEHAEGPIEDAIWQPDLSLVDLNNADTPGMTSLVHLREFSIVGPTHVTGVSETPSRRKIFSCRPASGSDELPCAKKILSTLARQAFRRPVTDSDLEGLLSFYQQGRNEGGFEAGIRTGLQAILADPEFVFRFERTPSNATPGSNYRVSDLELASRLSYFLWSSAPDDELVTVASQGRLKDPAVLEKQARRMLSDARSETLATIFASEWLHLQNLKDAQPDAFLFPHFNRNLTESMRRETELFFGSIVHEDRNVLDLLTANYTFVDEDLAKLYGIPNILGSRFRRVELADENRRGLLGQASILTLTSISNRTSPVGRGKFVMEVLLGTPPPPPLPNVPALKDTGDGNKIQTVRERMEEHRANPVCAACHKMMDPIGFSLENFDAIGAWRTKDNGFPVDASGQMFDGTKLDGPLSLRNAILNHSDAFLGAFSENLLAYGLGRVLDTYDMPAVRAIEHEAERNGNHFSSFVLGVVKSTPFQMRKAEGSAASGAHH